jgi:hypothetical protein
MKIEKSKHYKTRDGLKVWIADVNPFDRAPRAVKGVFCTENNSPYLPEWYQDGRFFQYDGHTMDLVAPWTAEDEVKRRLQAGEPPFKVGDLVRHKAVDTHHQFIVERIAGGHAFYHRPEGWGGMECNDQFSLLTLIAEAPPEAKPSETAKKATGLQERYRVERLDGKAIEDGCIVLEWADPAARQGIREFSKAVRSRGFGPLADDLDAKLQQYGHIGHAELDVLLETANHGLAALKLIENNYRDLVEYCTADGHSVTVPLVKLHDYYAGSKLRLKPEPAFEPFTIQTYEGDDGGPRSRTVQLKEDGKTVKIGCQEFGVQDTIVAIETLNSYGGIAKLGDGTLRILRNGRIRFEAASNYEVSGEALDKIDQVLKKVLKKVLP